MNATLLKALVALAATLFLLYASALLFRRGRSLGAFLQLLGAACLVVVVLAHVCEALRIFPGMRWGREGSPGHYLDLVSAILGITLFPIGYLLHARAPRRS
jgi:succinate dehydrogenase/fumarate reductase cytochrome b subunit